MSTGNSYIVYFNQNAEQVLLQTGYDTMSLEDKNSLVAVIANKDGKAYTDINADYILSYHKELKTSAINTDCENAIVGGFQSSNGHTYSLSRDDQLNMMGQKDQLMADATITVVAWKADDVGDWISHTRDEWLNQVYSEAFAHKKAQLLKCNTLKTQVNTTTTHDDLIKINW